MPTRIWRFLPIHFPPARAAPREVPATLRWQRHARQLEGRLLARADCVQGEAGNGFVEDLVPIDARCQVQEDPPEANRGTIHEHELARNAHRSLLLKSLVHREGLFA